MLHLTRNTDMEYDVLPINNQLAVVNPLLQSTQYHVNVTLVEAANITPWKQETPNITADAYTTAGY